MRIRNRQKPFPLLPVTHSDPNLINRSPVMVQLNGATTTATPKPSCTHGSATAPSRLLDRPQPFDPPIGNPINGSDASTGEAGRQHKKQESLVEDGRREEEGRGQKGNDTRKGSFSCSQQTPAETFPSSNPPKEDGGWCEGEKAFPLKKRRGRMENAMEDNNNDNNDNDHDKRSLKMKMKTKIKAKMNKKCSRQDEGEEEEEEEEEESKREMKPEANVGKKRARGGALMEGSRCSRVNGRGWRCLQQTLVGYSLCEHHLGKGRLRSMTSVRNKSIGTTTTTTTGATKNNNNNMVQLESSSSSVKQRTKGGNDAENNDEKKPLMVTKKRMKLGMVKARSISSLLGQTNNTEIVAVAVDHDHDHDNDIDNK
ncbi:myb-like protein V [Cajanus cajan]|uniref:WRC domain-containing protein n=1 Tax=Cajanus cajan TaxID=3821 RepID=A0A151QTU9_CAJCA|nr:myb-like protein V [Cajanus cajan]KYP33751.1 hypothetical protein KK1_045369 [Cajanus cajan]